MFFSSKKLLSSFVVVLLFIIGFIVYIFLNLKLIQEFSISRLDFHEMENFDIKLYFAVVPGVVLMTISLFFITKKTLKYFLILFVLLLICIPYYNYKISIPRQKIERQEVINNCIKRCEEEKINNKILPEEDLWGDCSYDCQGFDSI